MNKIKLILLICILNISLYSKEKVNINFNNLEIKEFIKIASKVINQNILITTDIKGKVNYISSKPTYKDEIIDILKYILKSKGYILVDTKGLLRVVKVDNDIEQISKKVVEVIYLKNTESKSILKIISNITDNKEYKNKNDKPNISSAEDINAIIVIAKKDDTSYIKELITKLDVNRQQVYVQARIIEISEQRTKEVGVKYGLLGGKSSSSGLLTFAASMGGNPIAINTPSIGLNLPNLDKGLALGATINLLNQNGAANIVSEPSLLCINNKESSIYVGETRSIKSGTTTTSGGNINDTYNRIDIGLTLKVKPRISDKNKVLLEISTKLEDVGQTTTNGQPNTTKKDLVTTAIVDNGESIILGGYVKSKKEYKIDKVPFLGDIPMIGELFKNNKEFKDKINLVIIITPYIVPKTKNLSYVRDNLAKLKQLEEQYTKNRINKLQKNKKIEDNQIDTKQKKQDMTNKELHDKRVQEMFGI
ncbi:MAG: type II and III secretion system protein:NolW [Campylobacterota bacterium]|nr:type II and III secretion system protein:NolW [Campylobacterota bacterium]